MESLDLESRELWYTDNPLRSDERIDEIRERNGTLELPPIIVYTAAKFITCREGFSQRYAIVDGNRRAFVDGENRRMSKARLLETDEDLEEVLKELGPKHGLIREQITTLDQLDNSLYARLQQRYRRGEIISYEF